MENRYRYMLTLHNPNQVPLLVIPFENLNFVKKFNDYNELSFTVPKYLYTYYNHSIKKNLAWEMIKQGMLVKISIFKDVGTEPQFEEYFSIAQPSFSESADSNSKQFSCSALHQFWFNKTKLRGFDATRQLFTFEIENGAPKKDMRGEVISKLYTVENPITREKETHAYNPNKIQEGGILNYILEYVLNSGMSLTEKQSADFNSYWKITDIDINAVLNNSIATISTEKAIEMFDDITSDWESIGEDYYNTLVRIFSSSEIDGTQKDEENVNAYIRQYRTNMQKKFIHVLGDESLQVDNIFGHVSDIIKEPYAGAAFLADIEGLLIETQTLMSDLCSFRYLERGQEKLSEKLAAGRNLCSFLLKQVLEKLYVYQNMPSYNIYRNLKFDNSNLTEVFNQLAESFNCVFEFDNVHKNIKILARDNEEVNKNIPLIITPYNYMQSINYQASTDQVITRLYPRGKEDIGIEGYNITGLSYVDDFSYFYKKEYIDNQDLINKLQLYQQLLSDVRKYQETRINPDNTKYTDDYCEAKFIIYAFQFFPANSGSDSGSSFYELKPIQYTLKSLQERLVQLQNTEAVCLPLMKGYINTSYSLSAANNSVTSPPTGEARTAGESELDRINSELEAYLYNHFSRYATAYDIANDKYKELQYIGTFDWVDDKPLQHNLVDAYESIVNSTNYDIHGDNRFYISHNIHLLELALVNWQKQFQYDNVCFTNINEQASVIGRDYDNEYLYTNETNRIFTTEDLQELSNYVYEEDTTFGDITDSATLYEYAIEYLQYINTIPLSIDIDMIDLLSSPKNARKWSDIESVGAKAYIQFEDYGLYYEPLRMISYTHNISAGQASLSVNFSNAFELKNLYNQVIKNVWVYAYRQINDFAAYKKTWEDYIIKQDALLLQGEQIYSDVNNIVNKAGQTVVDGSGLKISKTKYNGLKMNPDGYVAKDKTISSNGTTPEKLTPDHIVFDGAKMSTVKSPTGETTLTIAGMGGEAGLPRYYTAPYFSEKLWALDARRAENEVFVSDGENSIGAYWQEMKNNKHVWYRAEPVGTVGAYEKEQAVDFFNKPLYWIKASAEIGTDDRLYMTYEVTEWPVEIYKVTNIQEIFISERVENTHLPKITFGLGDGNGYGKGYIEKTNDTFGIYYTSRTTQNKLGIKGQDDGLYYTKEDGTWEKLIIKETGGGADSPIGAVKIIDHDITTSDIEADYNVYVAYDPTLTPYLQTTDNNIFGIPTDLSRGYGVFVKRQKPVVPPEIPESPIVGSNDTLNINDGVEVYANSETQYTVGNRAMPGNPYPITDPTLWNWSLDNSNNVPNVQLTSEGKLIIGNVPFEYFENQILINAELKTDPTITAEAWIYVYGLDPYSKNPTYITLNVSPTPPTYITDNISYHVVTRGRVELGSGSYVSLETPATYEFYLKDLQGNIVLLPDTNLIKYLPFDCSVTIDFDSFKDYSSYDRYSVWVKATSAFEPTLTTEARSLGTLTFN